MDWVMQQGMHNTGLRTPHEMMQHYRKYETASISALLTQDVLLMAGAEDHYVPVRQLPDQIASAEREAHQDRRRRQGEAERRRQAAQEAVASNDPEREPDPA